MKRRIRIKRKDRVRQRYWVGRKIFHAHKSERKWDDKYPEVDMICPKCGTKNWAIASRVKGYKGIIAQCGTCGYVDKADKFIHSRTKQLESKNYGGGHLFGRHLKEKGIQIEGTPKERKVIRRLFERNPELIEENITIIPSHLPRIGSVALGRYHHEPKIMEIDKEFLLTNKMTIPTKYKKMIITHPENTQEKTLKHEIAHARQLPMFTILKEEKGVIKLPTEERIEMISKNPLRDIKLKMEEEAGIAEEILPQRKRKVPHEQIAKSFREAFKNGA